MYKVHQVALIIILGIFTVISCQPLSSYVPANNIILDTNSIEMVMGEEYSLQVTVSPKNATNKKVIWTSSDASIASVSNGYVKANKTGTATISVISDDCGKSASCNITVVSGRIHVQDISLNKTYVNIDEGKSTQITALIIPEDATNKSIIWSTSNRSVATVSDNGCVTGIKSGICNITATTEDGNKTASCTVVISEALAYVTDVSLDKSSVSLKKGEYATLSAIVTPSNAIDNFGYWESSNPSVVECSVPSSVLTILSDVVIRASGVGTATITVKQGNKTASCKVTVSQTINYNGHSYVDLGLPSKLKWATCNIGASKPEELGYYFAWGETSTKSEYTISNYKYYDSNGSATKYSPYGTGFNDGKSILEPSDDAARVNWRGSWRMPTVDEMRELLSYCKWERTSLNGIDGYNITGPNGKSVFLPITHSSWSYWTSSAELETSAFYARCLRVTLTWGGEITHIGRYNGLHIRPVSD